MKRNIKEGTANSGPPINLTELIVDNDDCFGNEWQLTNPDCLKCTSYDLCMVVFSTKGNKAKTDKLKARHGGHFLDELNWDLVPWNDVLRLIQENPKKMSLNELRQFVKKKSNSADDYTVTCKVQDWLIQESIKIEEGWLYL